ncbi:hypothetical protein TRFO_26320 [Tritrichomonas foetus]|uniref:Uncharacterized protein n=1 Tax=Tritrichomonas foetus TaxID=1144522 RepID=A0A1J4K4C6_9EUKA|nr:hypothetical protein TRFO_26320 [Tritrichomonas foetus]|eukprot:OHT05818.1 hypothetical protein TRFO_26320 [Tritrichomonas foetus]
MFYKDLSSFKSKIAVTTLSNSTETEWDKDISNEVNKDDSQSQQRVSFLIDTLVNLHKSENPDDSLKTICQQLHENDPIDNILPNSQAIPTIIQYLHDRKKEFVLHALIALNKLVRVSPYTCQIICSNPTAFLFCELLNDSYYIDQLGLLLSFVVTKDDSLAQNLVVHGNILSILMEIFNHANEDNFVKLLNYFYTIFSNLKPEFFKSKESTIGGVKVISLPVPLLQEYIFSHNHSIIIPLLRIYLIVIQNWETELVRCLPPNIVHHLVKILYNAEKLDEIGTRIALKELLKIVRIWMLTYATNTNFISDFENIYQQLIDGLFNQIEKSPVALPDILEIFSTIANYENTSSILVRNHHLNQLMEQYNNFNYEMKFHFLTVFFRSSIHSPQQVIENCSNIIDTLLLDSFDTFADLNFDKYINEIEAFLKAIYSLSTINRDLITIFDYNELLEFLEKCKNVPRLFYLSQKIIDHYMEDDDVPDEEYL